MKKVLFVLVLCMLRATLASAETICNNVTAGNDVQTTLTDPGFSAMQTTMIDSRNAAEVDGAIFRSRVVDDGEDYADHNIESDKDLQYWYDTNVPLDGSNLIQHYHPGNASGGYCVFCFIY